MKGNLYSTFYSKFSDALDAPFMHLPASGLYTYRDIERLSAQYANTLTQICDPGDRVMLIAEKSPEVILVYLACLRAGLIFVPLNPAYTNDEIQYFYQDAAPTVLICETAQTQKYLSLMDERTCILQIDDKIFLDGIKRMSSDFRDSETQQDDVAVILYTSGTTGKPKGAMITHGNLIENGSTLMSSWGFTKNDVLLHMLPVFHVHGLFFSLHCVMLSAASMIFLPKFTAQDTLEYLPRSTVVMGVPTYYTRLLDDPNFTREAAFPIRLFVSGSAPLLDETFQQFFDRTGQYILERYGMTETGINTSNPLTGERRSGTVGVSLPGNSCRVVDDNDLLVNVNEPGHIQMKGKNIFKGYWNKEDKTAESFTSDGYFRTGDIGVLSDDGYLTIIGRSKDLIITGGLNVYPKEIELVIDQIDGVLESAVVGLPHPDFGESVNAVVVRKAGATLEEEDIIQGCKGSLANYKVPKTVRFVDELPRNTMGKVQKNLLRNA